MSEDKAENFIENLKAIFDIFKSENAQLKELLRKCYAFIDWCEVGVPVDQRQILMKEIEEVLK